MTQEDAHNTILDYDKDTSFFAVYDGHGGAEVAKYCAMKLPEFIKSLSSYSAGNLEEALREGFLQFDATLITSYGLSELKLLAGNSSDDSCDAEAEEGEAAMLHAEAEMPIEDLLARYSAKAKELAHELNEAKSKAEKEVEEGLGDAHHKDEKLVNGDCSASPPYASPADKMSEASAVSSDAGKSEDCGEGSSGGSSQKESRKTRHAWKPYMALASDEDVSSDSSDSEEEGEDEEDEEGEEDEGDGDEDEEEDEAVPGGGCAAWDKKFMQRLSQVDSSEDVDKAGYNSGCTAVVGLVRGHRLVVANAGDSRCVVCRSGQAVDMSLDHKPEDAAELSRICRAGGHVTRDGRVNGGLNLSRAIGDHAYKRNKELDLQDQMITALPDIKTLDLDPGTDEFMVLACDGIWNNMTSQEVVDFVKQELDKGTKPLSKICELLFDACLAPDTRGDGTGCDNMTCILAQFHPNACRSKKRSYKEDGEAVLSEQNTEKRHKSEPEPCNAMDT